MSLKNFKLEENARIVFLDAPIFKPVKHIQTTACTKCNTSETYRIQKLNTSFNRVNGFQLIDTSTGRFTGQRLVLSKNILEQLDKLAQRK